MLVFNSIFDLPWTGRGSSVRSVALLGFRELQQRGSKRMPIAHFYYAPSLISTSQQTHINPFNIT